MDPAPKDAPGPNGLGTPTVGEIVLAGRTYAIRRLTLGQLRRVRPLFLRAGLLTRIGPDNKPFFPTPEAAEEAFGISIDILFETLRRDHGMTREQIADLEASEEELDTAITTIARTSGLVPRPAEGAGPSSPPAGS